MANKSLSQPMAGTVLPARLTPCRPSMLTLAYAVPVDSLAQVAIHARSRLRKDLPPMTDNDLIHRAEALARRAHDGQTRDDSSDPYIVHPARVAARLAKRFPDDPALAAAGWCHDVLEDCPQISAQELRQTIGDDAFAVVSEVTNPSKQRPDLPRAERKAMDRAHIAVISRRARCLKLADRADNLNDGCASPDREWLATYVSESRALAEVLVGSDAELEAELAAAIDRAADMAGI